MRAEADLANFRRLWVTLLHFFVVEKLIILAEFFFELNFYHIGDVSLGIFSHQVYFLDPVCAPWLYGYFFYHIQNTRNLKDYQKSILGLCVQKEGSWIRTHPDSGILVEDLSLFVGK